MAKPKPPPPPRPQLRAGDVVVLRQSQEDVVRILRRHPPLELDAAATLDEQPVAIGRERVHIGVPRTGATAMGEDEAAQFVIDAHAKELLRVHRKVRVNELIDPVPDTVRNGGRQGRPPQNPEAATALPCRSHDPHGLVPIKKDSLL